MSFQEKSLRCSDCGASFTFTVQEQERFASKGLTNEPKHCSCCSAARKIELNENVNGIRNYGHRAQRQMFRARCAQCGKETLVLNCKDN